jgi:hypothetical protein
MHSKGGAAIVLFWLVVEQAERQVITAGTIIVASLIVVFSTTLDG